MTITETTWPLRPDRVIFYLQPAALRSPMRPWDVISAVKPSGQALDQGLSPATQKLKSNIQTSSSKPTRAANNRQSKLNSPDSSPRPAPIADELSANFDRQERLGQMFAALRHRNFRLYFFGQLVSLMGIWVQAAAQGYLVFELTSSSAYLGYVGFIGGIPAWLFTLYGGVIADRISRRRLLLMTQIAMMTLALLLAVDTFGGWVKAWHILLFALGWGVANAFDAPARHAIARELVGREDLTNAIALNSSAFNLATVLGPAVGGFLYAWVGPGWCFALNAISFSAVIFALLAMRFSQVNIAPSSQSALADLLEGLKFVFNHSVIRVLIFSMGVMSMLGFSLMTLIPAWAVTILHGDAKTNGYLMSARGLGSLIGSLGVAFIGQRVKKGQLLSFTIVSLPILIILFAVTSEISWAFVSLTLVGLSFMVMFNMLNALIQHLVPDELRGRVMSIYSLTFFGLVPLGSLWSGLLAEKIGEPLTIIINACAMLIFSAFFWWRFSSIRELA